MKCMGYYVYFGDASQHSATGRSPDDLQQGCSSRCTSASGPLAVRIAAQITKAIRLVT